MTRLAVTVLKGHVPALDGVRGLAILMVLVVHFIGNARPDNFAEKAITQLASYGAMGVDLFFVLSGFLITGILFEAKQKPSYFKNFYCRRMLRIFPLYFGVLIVALWIVPLFVQSPELNRAVEHQGWLWGHASNIFLAMRGDWEALPVFNHFWSLSVEEHFYFLWPLIVFVSDGPRLKRLALLIAGTAVLLRLGMVAAGVSSLAVYVLTPGRLDALALGGLMAVIAREEQGIERLGKLAPKVLVASLAFIVSSFVLTRIFPHVQELFHQLRQTAFAACFCAVLVLALVGPDWLRRLFESRPMTFFGKYSYGLYVYHFIFGYFLIRFRTEDQVAVWVGSHTLAIFVQAALGLAAAIAISFLSYHLFEKHFLRLKVWF